jgi:hypothetical protein
VDAKERLERMLRLAEEREARGEVASPEQVKAQEDARYADGNKVKWTPKSGEFEPVQSRRLKRTTPVVRAAPPRVARKDKPRKTTKARRVSNWVKLKAQLIEERGRTCEGCRLPRHGLRLNRLDLRKPREVCGPQDVVLLCLDCSEAKYAERHPELETHDHFSREFRRIIG